MLPRRAMAADNNSGVSPLPDSRIDIDGGSIEIELVDIATELNQIRLPEKREWTLQSLLEEVGTIEKFIQAVSAPVSHQ
ncbi:hypothetical protein [Azohydromonas australica]|uniref:hypothetical protein n=1 Tax=Azohydromonas australica TaxID=364039 RepID=UPI00146B6655|nr:hypothetical protein [Azohydromonas australica]